MNYIENKKFWSEKPLSEIIEMLFKIDGVNKLSYDESSLTWQHKKESCKATFKWSNSDRILTVYPGINIDKHPECTLPSVTFTLYYEDDLNNVMNFLKMTDRHTK